MPNNVITDATSRIATFLQTLNSSKSMMFLSSMTVDAVKIVAEYKYNELERTIYFQKIVSLEKKTKLLIVSVMLAFNALLKLSMKENNAWNLFWKDLLTDVAPELGKRIINGDKTPLPKEEEQVIDLILDPKTESHTVAKIKAPAKEKEPGFWDGFMSVVDERIKKSTQKR